MKKNKYIVQFLVFIAIIQMTVSVSASENISVFSCEMTAAISCIKTVDELTDSTCQYRKIGIIVPKIKVDEVSKVGKASAALNYYGGKNIYQYIIQISTDPHFSKDKKNIYKANKNYKGTLDILMRKLKGGKSNIVIYREGEDQVLLRYGTDALNTAATVSGKYKNVFRTQCGGDFAVMINYFKTTGNNSGYKNTASITGLKKGCVYYVRIRGLMRSSLVTDHCKNTSWSTGWSNTVSFKTAS